MSGADALYPFLRPADDLAVEALLAEATRSSVAKAEEIRALRRDCLETYADALERCADAMAASFRADGTLWTFGNGGSATDAVSVATAFLQPTHGMSLPAQTLTDDIAVITALANDVGIDVVFARQIAAFGRAGDIALGLSTSGNSGNVLRAFEEARQRQLVTVGFAGGDGGQMASSTAIDHLFVVPSPSVHRIQEAQTTLYHVLWEHVQSRLEGALPRP